VDVVKEAQKVNMLQARQAAAIQRITRSWNWSR
jgi:hypothetical protein